MERLQGRVAIITGGASGIGAATAKRFAAEGASVIVADLQTDLGAEIAAATGGLFHELDVADDAAWARLMAVVWRRFGRLDVVVNNAGIVSGQSIEDIDLATWNRVIEVNLTGVMLGCRHGISTMRKNPQGSGGALINIASTAAYAAIPSDAAYSATKSAVRMLTKAVAAHCARSGYAIRCNSLHPGATDTPILRPALDAAPHLLPVFHAMSPMGRMGRPEEIAAMAVFLASEEASYVTGGEFLVDGGMMAGHPGM
ncbi:glucose 1-dehydrogenase [Phenylobacterium sp.]|uniref:glucose 1-dehydrogenase n=1 Tax=Phenylobacterium sp. TaxID=1871053 RepID=UPI0025CED1E8|nr:glucose 1-dehydrogenase [Phenylobacterium sp.]